MIRWSNFTRADYSAQTINRVTTIMTALMMGLDVDTAGRTLAMRHDGTLVFKATYNNDQISPGDQKWIPIALEYHGEINGLFALAEEMTDQQYAATITSVSIHKILFDL